ncbi:MAG: nucleotidyltransferase [Planctomycetota bacterium]
MATTPLPQTYLTLLKSLRDADVDYLVVGGWAVICHGYVRATKDIDIWFEPDPHQASQVISVIESLGHRVEIDTIMRLSTERSVLRLGREPFGIDLMTSCDGCNWPSAWKRRVSFELNGTSVSVLSLADLRAAKRAAGRYRDLDDLENLPPVDGENDPVR